MSPSHVYKTITTTLGEKVHLVDPESSPRVGRIITRYRSLCGQFGTLAHEDCRFQTCDSCRAAAKSRALKAKKP